MIQYKRNYEDKIAWYNPKTKAFCVVVHEYCDSIKLFETTDISKATFTKDRPDIRYTKIKVSVVTEYYYDPES